MTEEARNEASTPLSVVDKTRVIQVLGKIALYNFPEEALIGTPRPNNTRWIFDLHDIEAGSTIRVQLLEYRNDRIVRPEMWSPSLCPLNSLFHNARPYCRFDDEGSFLLKSQHFGSQDDKGRFSCRVTIDTMHSANL